MAGLSWWAKNFGVNAESAAREREKAKSLSRVAQDTTHLVHIQVQHGQDGIRVALVGLVVVLSRIRLDRTPDQFLFEDQIRHAGEVEVARRGVDVAQQLGQQELDRVVVLRLRVKERKVDVEHLWERAGSARGARRRGAIHTRPRA